MKTLVETRSNAAVARVCLAWAAAVFANAADLNVPADYPTIQAAVNAAQSNDTVRIAPGVYTGQILVVRKSLTLVGAPGAVIRATAGMPPSLTPYDFCTVPLLGVALSEVNIRGITFEGEHLADGYACTLAAIIYSGSSGTIENCSVSGFRWPNLLGPFSGFGVVAGNNTTLGTGPVSVQILHSTFQDNAVSILVKGADAAPDRLQQRLSFTIEGNTITGVGPTTNGTQIGIYISPGAFGEVRHNTITDHAFNGSGAQFSMGILAADWLWLQMGQTPPAELLPVTYRSNTFRNNQVHLSTLYDNGGQIVGNTFAEGAGYRPIGVAVSGRNTLVTTNRFSDMPTGVTLLGDDADFPNGALGIAADSELIHNRFCNVTTNVVIEALASGTEQGTLACVDTEPILDSSRAVLLSWPEDYEGYSVETASTANGPWSASGATLFRQGGRNCAAMPADKDQQFFRLVKP